MKHPRKPELLAPAGSLEAFFAAMESGADAVYTGLKDFSARAKAKNVTLDELERMTAHARQGGRRVYVTLNTLIKERELPQLVETLAALEAIPVDGVILQDLAVWRLAREHFPGLELHGSTQLTVHNTAGVRMLERMGFTRVVLARELTLEQIAEIGRHTRLELEHFIHGALCFSFSGQCFFSSWLGGKSGNRGRCAQPCRRRYRHRQQTGYYLSTNDLSAIDLLPDLATAGVSSFKIEGRMKSAEYVANVVGAYRRVLDTTAHQRAPALREAKQLLKASFGRPPTRGFLPGGKPHDIALPNVKGATGRLLGEITAVSGRKITFQTRDPLQRGDRIRIQPRSDQAGTAFTVREIRQGRRPTQKAAPGTSVSVLAPEAGRFRTGDAVFKVSSRQAFAMSEAACRKRLAQTPAVPIPVGLQITMPDDQTLVVRGDTGDLSWEARYPVETFPARERPLSETVLREVFARTAREPFELGALTAEGLPAVVIPPSRLKEIRRRFYRELHRHLERERSARRQERRRQALEELLPASAPSPETAREVTVAIRDLRDLHIIDDPGVDRLLLSLTPAAIRNLEKLSRRFRDRPQRLVWDLPFILFDQEWEEYRRVVHRLVEEGFDTFRLNNLGHFPLFDGFSGLRLETGYRLFTLNSQAALAWGELGAERNALYLEDDRENLRDLLSRPTEHPFTLTVFGPVPLLVSRIDLHHLRGDGSLYSDRNEGYRVDLQGGLSVLTPEKDFSLLGHLRELETQGCAAFTVDLSRARPFTARGRQVLEAVRRDRPLPETSAFNFELGLE